MSRPVTYPPGSWPLELRAETAAAYVDEPSVDAFMAKVDRGVYSQPIRAKGMLPKWHRHRLDCDVARRHGFRPDLSAPAENIEGLV